MSRPRKKRPSARKKKTPPPKRTWWFTLWLLWPAAVIAVLLYQAHLRCVEQEAAVEAEIEQLEEQYQQEVAEWELKVDLLNKQIDLSKPAAPSKDS